VSKNTYKTYSVKKDDIQKKWVLVDAEDQPVGRLCSKIAYILRGKNKPEYSPHMDTGDNVIVINADKARFTGKKMSDKLYFRHTQYPGGEQFFTAENMKRKDPTFLVKNAIIGMLPKNRLGRQLTRNFRVFAGPNHNMQAQKPEKIEL